MKLDTQLAAFIAGLFVGLMVIRHITKRVLVEEIKATDMERRRDDESEPRSNPSNVVAFASHMGA